MAAEDIELIRAGFEAIERGDRNAAFARLSPDFELRDHVILEDTSTTRGPQAMAENIDRLLEAFDRISYEILESVELEDGRLLLRVKASAHTARDGGLDTGLEVGQIWTARDGFVKKLEIFPSFDEARRAAGLEAGS